MISRSCFGTRISMGFDASAATCSAPYVHARYVTKHILMCAILACAPGHQKLSRRKVGGNWPTLGRKKCRNIFTSNIVTQSLWGRALLWFDNPLYTSLPACLDSWLSAALSLLLSLRARASLRGVYNPTIFSLTIAYETSAIVHLLMDTVSFSPRYPNFVSTSQTRTLRIQILTHSNQQPDYHISKYFRLNSELILNMNGFSIHHPVQIACANKLVVRWLIFMSWS